jgi:hypothetical protein
MLDVVLPEVVAEVLKNERQGGDDAHRDLSRALESALVAVPDDISPPLPHSPSFLVSAEMLEQDGMHHRDAWAVGFLRALGPDGSPLRRAAEEVADGYAAAAREQWATLRLQRDLPGLTEPDVWARWRDTGRWPDRFAHAVGFALWRGEVADAVERKRSELARRLPGITVAAAEGIARVATRQLKLRFEGAGSEVIRPDPHRSGQVVVVAELLPTSIIEASRDLSVLGGRYALPLAETIIERSQLGSAGSVLVTADGARTHWPSWQVLASEALGARSGELHSDDVRNIRRAAWSLAGLRIRWPDGVVSSALWALDDQPPAPGNPGRGPVFTLSERAQYGATFRAFQANGARAGGGAEREMLRIVPLCRPRNVPPVPGSNRTTYGPQGTFRRLLWLHFTRHGEHMLEPEGGVPVTNLHIRDMADAASLPRALAPAMLPHLVRRDAVRELRAGRYAPADEVTAKFIEDGCRRRQEGREAARRGGRRRAGAGL